MKTCIGVQTSLPPYPLLCTMLLYLKILLLLWLINFAPPLAAYFFEDKGIFPVDGGKRWRDGEPLFGPHKTFRGIGAALVCGSFFGYAFGLTLWTGFFCAVLSMTGDLCSSFLKRRLKISSGNDFPGLDQGVEGVLPLVLLKYRFGSTWLGTATLLVLFSIGAYVGSRLYKTFLRSATTRYAPYPRPLKPRILAKEFASCHLQSRFWRSFIHFEDAIYYHLVIQTVFKTMGIYSRGKANALFFQRKDLVVELATLPPPFDGMRILFMSDLHLDGLQGLSERLITMLPEIEVDLCLLGGDYRMATHGSCRDSLTRLGMVTGAVKSHHGIIAVLGNHDCIEMTEALSGMGVHVLVNDAICLEKDGKKLWIAGTDDPHYYKCEDIGQTFGDIPPKACTLFLAHSPELYRQVSHRADLYLAGHTHGGQIQIPPIGPVFTHCKAPRRVCVGRWSEGDMQGYTSNGVGVSGVPVRFNCPGEIVVITLRCDQKETGRQEKRSQKAGHVGGPSV
ncbi:CDP-archaeol synthase [Desulfoplanes sp.]